jgi:hypothetical protein
MSFAISVSSRCNARKAEKAGSRFLAFCRRLPAEADGAAGPSAGIGPTDAIGMETALSIARLYR